MLKEQAQLRSKNSSNLVPIQHFRNEKKAGASLISQWLVELSPRSDCEMRLVPGFFFQISSRF